MVVSLFAFFVVSVFAKATPDKSLAVQPYKFPIIQKRIYVE